MLESDCFEIVFLILAAIPQPTTTPTPCHAKPCSNSAETPQASSLRGRRWRGVLECRSEDKGFAFRGHRPSEFVRFNLNLGVSDNRGTLI